ncbi:FAD-binding oxidoreductase [Wenxinia saemankumensis]|uniref:Ferredoxin-NADP reductase n=1 Tax=Wenxinia saemankumensis TaxID=1447782 RepID=A0A1M6A254_9RHOB|nr:FAD-binding oxidoreductase [Wenxinia saemankumensis]SHI30581.1 Ferredoxin-NADP reductase [Wenxinia saemankumensis]
MTHIIELQEIAPVTHDTFHLVLTRPEGISWTLGQATKLAVDKDGWRDEGRPFTMTGDPQADHLEFVIKTYPDHDGTTNQIRQLTPGDTLRMGSIWGAIEDKGPGTFLAGGAGLTPFISILRQREKDGALDGCRLIFSNAAEEDIILRDEWERMPGLETTWVLTEEDKAGFEHGQIDGDFLDRQIRDWRQHFYICGPIPMEEALKKALMERGVDRSRIVIENHPD